MDPKYRPDWQCTVPVAFIPHQRIEIESSRWNSCNDDMDHRPRLRLTLAPPTSSKKHCAVSTDAFSTPILQNIRCNVRAARRAKCCFIRWLPGRLTGSVSNRLQSRAFFSFPRLWEIIGVQRQPKAGYGKLLVPLQWFRPGWRNWQTHGT